MVDDSPWLYTLRSSGARGLDLSPFYRHIAPLERTVENFSTLLTMPDNLTEAANLYKVLGHYIYAI